MVYSETRYVPDNSGTGWFVGIVVALALVAIGYLIFSGAPASPAVPLTSAHVQIDLPKGHGSATHIGNGLYVTAAHVVDDHATVKINGTESAVLWASAEYDVALVSGPEQAASVPLWCGVAKLGQAGESHGNPMDFTDITTTLTVAGEARTIGKWKVALPMDGTVGPGMSGGGWVVGGALAGVNVGAAMAPTTIGAPSYFGLSIVVPSSVICQLMGRT